MSLSNPVSFNVKDTELLSVRDCCVRLGAGIHLTRFFDSSFLDGDINPYIAYLKTELRDIKRISVHSPFMDLIPSSSDKLVKEAARKRHEKALWASFALGAESYIVHTGYNPLIRHEKYDNTFTDRLLSFWLPFADACMQNNLTICFENIWDKSPSILLDIVTKANHPNIKALFDNGHALIYSDFPSSVWIESLKDHLCGYHLHDNDGINDSHLPLGGGIEDIEALIDSIKKHTPNAHIILECAKLSENLSSYALLKD
jgi:sugar phosphate isomerase/epimerase